MFNMKSDIITSANLVYSGAQTVVTANGVRTIYPNPYNDGGCSGNNNCKGYYIGVPCLIELYQGITACQYLYLMDGNGNPVDLNRVDYMSIGIFNEYECEVMRFSTLEGSDADGTIDFFQESGEKVLLDLNPKNFMDCGCFFDLNNVRVLDADAEKVCPDDRTAIIVGGAVDDCVVSGNIFFNPLDKRGDMHIRIEPAESNNGECVVRYNGMPYAVEFGVDMPLIDLDETESGVIEIVSETSDYEPSIAEISRIVVSDESDVTDVGKFRICYDGDKTANMLPSFLTAVVEFKFKDSDKEERGATHVISCVKLGTLKRHRPIV